MNKVMQKMPYLPICKERLGYKTPTPTPNPPPPPAETSWAQGITFMLLLAIMMYIMAPGNIFVMQG